MLLVLAALLIATALVVLFLQGRHRTLLTLAAATLVVALAVLAATGRLHWLVPVIAAVLPFLRRGLGLLRYVPLFRSLFARRAGGAGPGGQGPGGQGPAGASGMTRNQALEVLGLTGQPSRQEIVDAHRRLIQKLHPDRGGSNYLAQQLNDARRRLLEDT